MSHILQHIASIIIAAMLLMAVPIAAYPQGDNLQMDDMTLVGIRI